MVILLNQNYRFNNKDILENLLYIFITDSLFTTIL